ncbi:MAG: hypothetical protein IPJ06_04605 [Saprospiraceae bacterium]|nr:hypothetical protein [Saprospiraceae bacterium]
MKKQLMKFAILFGFGLFLVACGNSEEAAPAEEAAPVEEAAPAPAPAEEAAPATEGTEAGGTLVQPEEGQ